LVFGGGLVSWALCLFWLLDSGHMYWWERFSPILWATAAWCLIGREVPGEELWKQETEPVGSRLSTVKFPTISTSLSWFFQDVQIVRFCLFSVYNYNWRRVSPTWATPLFSEPEIHEFTFQDIYLKCFRTSCISTCISWLDV
jgi:hypothetical protein